MKERKGKERDKGMGYARIPTEFGREKTGRDQI